MRRLLILAALVAVIGAFLTMPSVLSSVKFATSTAGDVDLSGSIDAVDVQLVINSALGLTIDSDGDGLCDSAEARLGTDPQAQDSDGDDIGDLQEYYEQTLEGGGGEPNTFYVDGMSGEDSNPGTLAQPWRTLQYAGQTATAGQTVYIRAGTYAERLIPQNSGGDGNYIVFSGYPGETVTIDGTSIVLPDDQAGLVEIADRAYIRISGLRIVNAGPNGDNTAVLVMRSNHVTIENNYTNNTVSSGIGVWESSDVLVDGNEVVLACNDGQQECITLAGVSAFEVRNNVVHDGGPGTNGGEGIDAKDGSYNGSIHDNDVYNLNSRLGIYLDAWDKHTYNIEVYRNRVHDIFGADGFTLASEVGGLLENIRIFNNVAYRCAMNGITISYNGLPAPLRPIHNVWIVNNTFYQNGSADWGGGISIENPDIQSIVIRNNICSENVVFQIQIDSGYSIPLNQLTIDYNLIDPFRDYGDEVRGDSYVEDSAAFVNAASGDFHLTASSAAIDQGRATDAPAQDFDGTTRPQGTGYDIGAFEFAGR
ncbi:MAG: right-handed parallel beta-helix repeat-containing protein [Candidatus Hydrogenedentes bacterium]|nr:right-handed parallel beta-helix repeat-containing protein [Candidatus Hydrogenedentota bacterium]